MLDQIQNGRISVIIYFVMPDVMRTVPDSYTINIKQNVWFQGWICFEKFQLEQI